VSLFLELLERLLVTYPNDCSQAFNLADCLLANISKYPDNSANARWLKRSLRQYLSNASVLLKLIEAQQYTHLLDILQEPINAFLKDTNPNYPLSNEAVRYLYNSNLFQPIFNEMPSLILKLLATSNQNASSEEKSLYGLLLSRYKTWTSANLTRDQLAKLPNFKSARLLAKIEENYSSDSSPEESSTTHMIASNVKLSAGLFSHREPSTSSSQQYAAAEMPQPI